MSESLCWFPFKTPEKSGHQPEVRVEAIDQRLTIWAHLTLESSSLPVVPGHDSAGCSVFGPTLAQEILTGWSRQPKVFFAYSSKASKPFSSPAHRDKWAKGLSMVVKRWFISARVGQLWWACMRPMHVLLRCYCCRCCCCCLCRGKLRW